MSAWKTADILAYAREQVATANCSKEELEGWCARLLAASKPFLSTLMPLTHVACEAIWVRSDLFPYQREADEPADSDSWWGSNYATKTGWTCVPFDLSKENPEYITEATAQIDEGTEVHDSYAILSVSGTQSIASIFYGSFSTDDVKNLELAQDPKGAS